MQNLIQISRQSSTVFEKPGFLSKKSKTLTSSNCYRVQYFLLKPLHVSYLPMSKKGVRDFFFILSRF